MHLLSWKVLNGDEDNLAIRLERDIKVSSYAILSHRWGKPEDEVSFEDFTNGKQTGKKGYEKLNGCCKQAQKDGMSYVWIDTCCINKASSAELSEAITSMFTYYERSKVCYVFMDDVTNDPSSDLQSSSFTRSAWFTRGWTLQELIAPQHVEFFDSSWSFLGRKTDSSLGTVIESLTGIDSTVLNIPATTRLVSVSKRMSWAARRKTTRPEDAAYSLMGIFGVYMSPLYGEGYHAFIRLQEAIMKSSNDQTIFAWTSPPTVPLTHGLELVTTMLALSPDQFERSAAFKSLSYGKHNKEFTLGGTKVDYALTNAGLAIRLPIVKIPEVEGLYAAFLACTEDEYGVPSAIFLRTSLETPAGYFWRTNCNEGPIERSRRRWFPLSGREAVPPNDVYIMPRFSSVSGDNIEPSWSRVDIAKVQCDVVANGPPLPKSPSLTIDTAVLNGLNHVVDPSFGDLAFLRQAQQMISTNQADQLVDMIRTKLRFPKILPYPRNRNFYGRAVELQQLRDALFPADTNRKSQGRGSTGYTISGIMGVGKTQVVLEFSHDCIKNGLFETVIWINANTSQSIHEGFESTAAELKLVTKGSSPDTVVHGVLGWLSEFGQHASILGGRSYASAKWLLVFDNVQDASLLLPFMPSDGPGCVLAVSRDPNAWFTLGFERIAIEPLTIQESSELFRRLTKKEWDFSIVSEQIGGLPLAIAHFAGFIIKSGLSLEEFLRLWRERQQDTQSEQRSSRNYRESLVAVWSQALRNLSSASLGILQVISFLAPDFIPDWLLLPSGTLASRQYPQNESDLLDSRGELVRLALISRSSAGDGISVHRLIQSAVRERMDSQQFQTALSSAVTLVSSVWSAVKSMQQRMSLKPKICDELLPHVLRLGDFRDKMIDSEDGSRTKTDFVKLWGWAQDRLREQGIAVDLSGKEKPGGTSETVEMP